MHFLESIKCLHGRLHHLPLHQARLDRTRREVLGLDSPLPLEKIVVVPPHARAGLWKCRVVYAQAVEAVEFEPYAPKPVRELVLVQADGLDYAYKYADRSGLQQLAAATGGDPAVDILMVKNGLLTDASYANVLLYDGCRWVTPTQPLLMGTKRAYYLQKGLVTTADLAPDDLRRFKKVALVNALRDLDSRYLIGVGNIRHG
jgi:4-amino-4-deoxychorismate lyase